MASLQWQLEDHDKVVSFWHMAVVRGRLINVPTSDNNRAHE